MYNHKNKLHFNDNSHKSKSVLKPQQRVCTALKAKAMACSYFYNRIVYCDI